MGGRVQETNALSKELGLQRGEVVLNQTGVALEKWANGGSGAGHLTLTNMAVYFQVNSKS